MPRHLSLLRTRSGHAHHRVTFVELFFDLIFVFAVTQLSHGLMAHFSPLGLLHTGMLMLAVWWVWIFTSWVTNWLDPEKLPVRGLLLAIMLAGLVMSASLPEAFGARAWPFAISYVAMQVGRTLFMIWAMRGHHALERNAWRILVWLSGTGLLWLAGAASEGETRLLLWGAALVIEYVSPSTGFWTPGLGRSSTADWDVEGGHLSERCALFIIIALGESILVTGATFSDQAWDATTVAAFASTFIGSLAMWWLYFDTSAEAGSQTISHSDDPGRLARLAYTYLHLFLVAGIIVSAVGDELVLAHPLGHVGVTTSVSVLGGAGIYLLGNTLFKHAIMGRWQISPLLGIAALIALAAAAPVLTPLLLSILSSLVLCAVATWEAHVRRHCPEPTLG